MKKFISVIACLSFMLALTACDSDKGATSSSASNPTSSVNQTSSTPVSSTETSSADVSSGAPVDSLNLAFRGTAIADGLNEQYSAQLPITIEALNDGDHTTRWQSSDKKESKETPSWFGIQWTEAQTFDTIITDWENAHPLEDGFRVETSEDGETWTDVEFTSVRTGTKNDGQETFDSDHQMDTITLKTPITTKYIRIVCETYYTVPEGHENAGNEKAPASCFEIEIYNSADVDATSSEATASEAE